MDKERIKRLEDITMELEAELEELEDKIEVLEIQNLILEIENKEIVRSNVQDQIDFEDLEERKNKEYNLDIYINEKLMDLKELVKERLHI